MGKKEKKEKKDKKGKKGESTTIITEEISEVDTNVTNNNTDITTLASDTTTFATDTTADTTTYVPSTIIVPPAADVKGKDNKKKDHHEHHKKEKTKYEPLREQFKMGYLATSGKYKDVDHHNRVRSQLYHSQNMDKVKQADLDWESKTRQDMIDMRNWPPKNVSCCKRLFWTTGHYEFGREKWFTSRGLEYTTAGGTTTTTVTETDTTLIQENQIEGRADGGNIEDGDDLRGRRQSPGVVGVLLSEGITKKGKTKKSLEQTVVETTTVTKTETKKEKKEKKGKKGKVDEEIPETPQPPSLAESELPPALKADDFSTHRLHVGNLPITVQLKDLEKLFKGATEITMTPDENGTQVTAMIRYEDDKKAFAAFQKNKKSKFGGKPLVVSPKLREP